MAPEMAQWAWPSCWSSAGNNRTKKENIMIIHYKDKQNDGESRLWNKMYPNFGICPFDWIKEAETYNPMTQVSVEKIADLPMLECHMQPAIEHHLFMTRKLQYMEWLYQKATDEVITTIFHFEVAQKIGKLIALSLYIPKRLTFPFVYLAIIPVYKVMITKNEKKQKADDWNEDNDEMEMKQKIPPWMRPLVEGLRWYPWGSPVLSSISNWPPGERRA